jgi:dihydroneopterin aldolase
LHETVDYGSLVSKVKHAIESDPVDLIETLAARIAELCLADARVRWTEVTVHKPDAPVEATFADVALTITRGRDAVPTAAPPPDQESEPPGD